MFFWWACFNFQDTRLKFGTLNDFVKRNQKTKFTVFLGNFSGGKIKFLKCFQQLTAPRQVVKYGECLQIKALNISFLEIYNIQPFVFSYCRPGHFCVKTLPPDFLFFAHSGPDIIHLFHFFVQIVKLSHLWLFLINFTFTVSFSLEKSFCQILTV